MSMKAYKIVRAIGGELWSNYAPLRYFPGQWATPLPGDGPLFVHARPVHWARYPADSQLWECEWEPWPTRLPRRNGRSLWGWTQHWGPSEVYGTTAARAGKTRLARAVRLVRRVW